MWFFLLMGAEWGGGDVCLRPFVALIVSFIACFTFPGNVSWCEKKRVSDEGGMV